jgi:hypothetical protein
MKKMDIGKFKIGDPVLVFATIEFHTHNGTRDSTRTQFVFPKIGVVTGIGKRYEGELCEGGMDYEFGNQDPIEFQQTKQVMGWLVRFGMSNKEQFVQEDDIERAAELLHPIPYQTGKYVWKPKDRVAAREAMELVKRDAKGRWLR